MKYGKAIKLGPGVEALPAAGHARKEMLKRRMANAEKVAEEMVNATDGQVYSVDPKKLREEPEILRHYDVSLHMFKVTKAVPGRVYFWERDTTDDHSAIARKQSEARMWLGDYESPRGWNVVSGIGNGTKNPKWDEDSYPESPELRQADGVRRIGDVILMWIPLHEYERIQKRIMLATRFKEANISQKLSDFVREHEGLVKVISGPADPQTLYRKAHPESGPLQHTSRGPEAIQIAE